MGPRSENLILNYVFNFRRATHFRLCLLETQVENVKKFYMAECQKKKKCLKNSHSYNRSVKYLWMLQW